MSLSDFLYAAGAVVASLGGGAALVLGISSYLGKIWAERILEKEKHQFEVEITRLTSELSLQVELAKSIKIRYFENQFTLYHELWVILCNLRKAGDDLWENASKPELATFARALSKAEATVEQSLLFIEDEHYRDLKDLFHQFREFRFGKSRLMGIRANNHSHDDFNEREIQYVINHNEAIRTSYSDLLDDVGRSFKKQLKGSP